LNVFYFCAKDLVVLRVGDFKKKVI